jgi:hypothetical protein
VAEPTVAATDTVVVFTALLLLRAVSQAWVVLVAMKTAVLMVLLPAAAMKAVLVEAMRSVKVARVWVANVVQVKVVKEV